MYAKERLPKSEGKYLVVRPFMSHYSIDICWFAKNLEEVDDYEFSGKKYAGFFGYDSEWGFCEKPDVLFWAPIPELPSILRGDQ